MRLSKYDDDTNDVEELYDSGAELEFEVDEDDVVYEDEKKPFYRKPFMYICILLIGFAIFFNIRYKIVIVSGESMIPTLKDGQILIANKSFTIDRFDIVVVQLEEKSIIKRVIGLPGETVEYKDNVLYINGEEQPDKYNHGVTTDFKVTLGQNDFFCLGDNREHSMDSRVYGTFNRNVITAKIRR